MTVTEAQAILDSGLMIPQRAEAQRIMNQHSRDVLDALNRGSIAGKESRP